MHISMTPSQMRFIKGYVLTLTTYSEGVLGIPINVCNNE